MERLEKVGANAPNLPKKWNSEKKLRISLIFVFI